MELLCIFLCVFLPLAICMPAPLNPPSIRRSCVSWLITVSKQTGAARQFAVINLLLSFCFRRAFVSGQKLGRLGW